MKILAIDLGKYKSVACNYVTATGTARFATVVTHVLELDRLLLRESPDLVFNLVEGVEGKGALATQAQRALDALGMPYTGTSGAAMDATNDKVLTKHMVRAAGLDTADWAEGPPFAGLRPGKWIVKFRPKMTVPVQI